jgi:hypothetical protein
MDIISLVVLARHASFCILDLTADFDIAKSEFAKKNKRNVFSFFPPEDMMIFFLFVMLNGAPCYRIVVGVVFVCVYVCT